MLLRVQGDLSAHTHVLLPRGPQARGPPDPLGHQAAGCHKKVLEILHYFLCTGLGGIPSTRNHCPPSKPSSPSVSPTPGTRSAPAVTSVSAKRGLTAGTSRALLLAIEVMPSELALHVQ